MGQAIDEALGALLPEPRKATAGEGVFPLRDIRYVRLVGDAPGLAMAGRVACRALAAAQGRTVSLVAGDGGPNGGVGGRIALDSAIPHEQGYRLRVGANGFEITARSPAGAFYGAQTLAQWIQIHPDRLPAVEIVDSPDYPARGVMLDISRDKVPTTATLCQLVDELAALKINQLQLYTEHTFAYRAHPVPWAQASPMTGEEILALDAYCRERFVELVPNQNSFGHLERWLKHPEYLPLAEAPDGFDFPWGRHAGPFSLCPIDPRSVELVAGWYDELLPHFTSRLFNVGCDETFDVGQGRSKEACAERRRERIYLEYLLKIHGLVRKHGRRMQFWGDIILHRPELIPELPKDLIALEWGYEAEHPFEKDGRMFAEAGVAFYVCPGTSSWCSLSGRTDNVVANQRNAAENGLKHGAVGYLNTDWGDWGHLQYLPVSYLGFAAGAARGWRASGKVADEGLVNALDRHIFRDRSGVMGRLAWDLGNVYRAMSGNRPNGTNLFWRLVGVKGQEQRWAGAGVEDYTRAMEAIDAAMARLDAARMDRPDAALIVDEFRNGAEMMRHAAQRGRWMLDSSLEKPSALAAQLGAILGEHRRLWLARNRVGGLADSARRLETKLEEYR